MKSAEFNVPMSTENLNSLWLSVEGKGKPKRTKNTPPEMALSEATPPLHSYGVESLKCGIKTMVKPKDWMFAFLITSIFIVLYALREWETFDVSDYASYIYLIVSMICVNLLYCAPKTSVKQQALFVMYVVLWLLLTVHEPKSIDVSLLVSLLIVQVWGLVLVYRVAWTSFILLNVISVAMSLLVVAIKIVLEDTSTVIELLDCLLTSLCIGLNMVLLFHT